MPDYVRPNITVPTSLWGEVKVSAFRRGMKPCEVVIELIRERFDDDYRGEKGMPSRASVKALRDKVENLSVDTKPSVASAYVSNPPPVARKHPVVESPVGSGVGGGQAGKDALKAGKEAFAAPLVDSMSANHHLCAICKISFPESEMEYHAKTMKWACRECAENQRNGQ